MKVELKKIKHFPAGSQETPCFVAELWLDGVKRGEVRNDGQGGSHMFSDHRAERELDTWASTLPRHTIEGLEGTFPQRGEYLISELIDVHIAGKHLKRLLAKHLIYTRRGATGVWQTKTARPPMAVLATEASIQDARNRLDIDRLLNLLPFEEALAIYVEQNR